MLMMFKDIDEKFNLLYRALSIWKFVSRAVCRKRLAMKGGTSNEPRALVPQN